MRGRPPKPKDLRILEGTDRADRHGAEGEVPNASGQPVKPVDLTPEASACWDFVVPEIVAMNIGKTIDSLVLRQMVESWSLMRQCYDVLKNDPSDKDARIAYLGYGHAFESIAARFGMTPSDRSRLRVEDTKKPQGIKARTRA